MTRNTIKLAIATLLLGATLLLPTPLKGQGNADGYLLSRYRFGITDMLNLSQYNTSVFGTARSVAMGGAYTSLGANLSSMHINPAGLGMYRSSEFGFTPSLIFNEMENTTQGLSTISRSRNRLSINNIGVALNLYQGTGAVTSFTLGFSYNKLADFNFRSYANADASGKGNSIGRVFENQLRGIEKDDLLGSAIWGYGSRVPVDHWGAALGYKSFMLDTSTQFPLNNRYDHMGVSDLASVSHLMSTESKGSIGEYAISGGMNIKNKLYIGLTIGIQSINIRQSVGYDEGYTNNTWHVDSRLDGINYDQYTKVTGTGVDFKLGLIYRPVESLRLGVAFHSPKYYSVDKRYSASMYTMFTDDTYNQFVRTDNGVIANYSFNSAPKIMFGASYIIAKRAIISVDLERNWYNAMRFKSGGTRVEESYKSAIKNNFKATNTLKAGLELLITPSVSARAGFSYLMDSPIKHNRSLYLDSPMVEKQYSISAGLGFTLSRITTLDVTYAYIDTKYSEYDMYYYVGENNDGSPANIYPGLMNYRIAQKLSSHTIMASLSIRF